MQKVHRAGIGRVAVLILVILVVAVLVGGTWFARRYLWFGSPPPPANYAALQQQLAVQRSGDAAAAAESWRIYEQIVTAVLEVDEAITGTDPRNPDGSLSLRVNYSALLEAEPSDSAHAEALQALQELQRRNMPALLDQLAGAPTAARPQETPGQLYVARRNDLTAARQLTRGLVFNFATAWRAGDEHEAIRIQRHLQALARHVGAQATIIERILGGAIGMAALEGLRDELVQRPPSAESAQSLLALWSPPVLPPVTHALEGERLVALDMFENTLSDTRLKLMSRGAQMEKINEFYDLAVQYAKEAPESREADLGTRLSSFEKNIGPSYPFAGMLIPAIGNFINSADGFDAMHAGMVTMLAIELFMSRSGEPPESLAALVPQTIAKLPGDPLSPTGFVYRRDTASPRGYLLYSFGYDRADDGGARAPKPESVALMSKGAGFDYVFVGPP